MCFLLGYAVLLFTKTGERLSGRRLLSSACLVRAYGYGINIGRFAKLLGSLLEMNDVQGSYFIRPTKSLD